MNLAGQYPGVDTFVGVDSGLGSGQPGAAALNTSVDGLVAAGSAFVNAIATGSSTSTAVSQANSQINQTTMDKGDEVVIQDKKKGP